MGDRQPLPVSVLRYCAINPNPAVSSFLHQRDLAMTVLAFRLMRRANEVSNLRMCDVKFKSNGWMAVYIMRSKTMPFEGRTIEVEPVPGSVTCPVRLMQSWLKLRPRATPFEPLFVSVQGKPVTTNALLSVVRRMAAYAGFEGRVSSHSLHIGGATAAMQAGMTMAQIRAIGGWESKAIGLYLRAVGAAAAGASAKMGL
jgi:integrase